MSPRRYVGNLFLLAIVWLSGLPLWFCLFASLTVVYIAIQRTRGDLHYDNRESDD